MLAGRYVALIEQGWAPVFRQGRTLYRSLEHALAWPCSLGRHTISRNVCLLGRSQQDWSADYKLFSRSPWEPQDLFQPVWNEYLKRYPEGPVAVALDDTRLAKTGRKIRTAGWQRDPMSPPFRANLMFGLRFLQASLLFPHYREAEVPARGYPVAFQEAPCVKRPGYRAGEREREQYRLLRQQTNLPRQAAELVREVRDRLDRSGGGERVLRLVVDGGFCNRNFFRAAGDRVELVARCRRDARLCQPAAPGSRRKYDPEIFTPEQVHNGPPPWETIRVYFGGAWRELQCKSLTGVLWKRGAGTRPLRLIVLAPTPYRTSRRAPINYRCPAYLLTTDLHSPLPELIQDYCDRWQIEVNHRDEKDVLRVGQAQVRSPRAVPRHPAFAVACYSLLLLAALLEFGPGRTDAYPILPKWRRQAKRPSLVDLLTVLRTNVNETSVWPTLSPLNLALRAWG